MRLPALVIALSIAIGSLAAGSALAGSASKPGSRTFKGTIAAVSKDHGTIRVARSGKSSVKFAVRRSTKVTGSGTTRATLKKGLAVTVTARKGRHGFVASKLVISTGGSTQPGNGPMEGIPYDGPPAGGEDGAEGGF